MSQSFKDRTKSQRDVRLRPSRNADNEWLAWVAKKFKGAQNIDRQTFKKVLQVKNEFFADRFFDVFDEDKTGMISLAEMMDGLFLLNEGTKEDKIQFFFTMYDLDNNGELDKDELRSLLKTGMVESSVQLSENKLNHLTDTLFTSADQDNSGSISFDEFLEVLVRHPGLMENFSIGASAWLKSSQVKKTNQDVRSHTTAASYILNNIKRIGFLLFIFLINLILVLEAVIRYSKTADSNCFFLAARGCGSALNFDCSVVVLLMLRKVLSFLRTTWLLRCLPFDDTINIHKLIGYLCFVLGIIHTIGHVGNALILQTYKNFTAVELLFTDPGLLPVGLRVGELEGSAFITGWILIAVLLILICGSVPYVRRSGHFQVFFWTHKICYCLFWFVLILHTPSFWLWFILPAFCFILEKVFETKLVKRLRFGKTYIKEVNLLPSGVTHLVLPRPRNFKYKAGDYIFIQIPGLAKHEWHPFTISSAPEEIDTVSVHIRSAGNWTKRLYHMFDLMTSHSIKRGHISVTSLTSNQGNVNKGFEMSPTDGGDEEANVATVEEYKVDHSGMDGSDEDSSEYELDFEEDEVRPHLTIRRVSYQPPEELPTTEWKKAHDAPTIMEKTGEEEEDEVDDEAEEDKHEEEVDEHDKEVDENEKEVDENEMEVEQAVAVVKKEARFANEHQDTSDVAELTLGNDSASVTVEIEPTSPSSYKNYDRRKSKPFVKPNVKFDLKAGGRLRVHIQGPYGTPSTSIFHSEHAVMIGAGIGVTPYASILQSIMYRHRNIISECPNCNHSWVDLERQKRALRVRKVDFIWMNRNYMAFEWFVDLLLHLENQQSEYSLDRFLDIHLFITGMKRFDLKNIGLQMALDLVHEKENRDLLTGLKTKLQAGRPDWEKLFTKIKSENRGKVSVFFCGAPALGSVIKSQCNTFGFKFHKESF
ncbi:NADPH oxidase 5-like [Asterias rubens]|uniref:NADPH oxidase 5-like n=1 Tax=Asterias rubens TaxID=7604 RepID=UPI001455A2CB|nr:NADPH oxidase 5-like [Asterias rubens]